MAMTERRTDDDRMLERFFAAARAETPVPDTTFLTILMNEAEAALPVRSRRMGGGRIAGWLALLGGWKAVGGLATAAVTGIWIGFAGVERLLPVADSTAPQIEADAGGSFLADSDILVLAAK